MKHYRGNKITEQCENFPAQKFRGFVPLYFIFCNKICKPQTFCTPMTIRLIVTIRERTEWLFWCCPVQENKGSNWGVPAWRCSKESNERTTALVPSSPVHLYIRSIHRCVSNGLYERVVIGKIHLLPLKLTQKLCRRMTTDPQPAVLERRSYRRQNPSSCIPPGSVRRRGRAGAGEGPAGSASFRSGFFCPAGDGSGGSHGGGGGAAEALGGAGAAAGLPRLRGAGGRRAAGAGKAGWGAGGTAAPPAALGAARQPHLPAGARPAEAHPGELRAARASARIRASPPSPLSSQELRRSLVVGGGSCGGYVGWMAGRSGSLLN